MSEETTGAENQPEPTPKAPAPATPETPAEVAGAPSAAAAKSEGDDLARKDDGAVDGDGESSASEADDSRKRAKGRQARTTSAGVAHIRATFNNTMVTICDRTGGVVSWSSAGRAGFKGSRKSTAFAATIVGQEAARGAVGKGMREVEVEVRGAGSGRESAVRALQSAGLTVSVIRDVTPIPHNGCRPRKRRRV